MTNFPVVLEATIPSIAANTIGSPLDARSLQNKTSKLLRIEEIRFPKADTSDRFSMSAQLRIGNEPVTNGFVPIAAMTWQIADIDALTSQNVPARHLFFSKPVLLAPGQTLNVQVRHSAGAQSQEVVAICTPVDFARPSFMPWITHFQPTPRVDGGGNFDESSTESDLVNPFDQEMIVERLIGRLFYENGTNPGRPLEVDAFTSPAGQLGLAFDGVRVIIEDHEASEIVRDATPFGVVFEFSRKTWIVNAKIRPKGFYRVTVQSNLAVAFADNGIVYELIGMLGYREVR